MKDAEAEQRPGDDQSEREFHEPVVVETKDDQRQQKIEMFLDRERPGGRQKMARPITLQAEPDVLCESGVGPGGRETAEQPGARLPLAGTENWNQRRRRREEQQIKRQDAPHAATVEINRRPRLTSPRQKIAGEEEGGENEEEIDARPAEAENRLDQGGRAPRRVDPETVAVMVLKHGEDGAAAQRVDVNRFVRQGKGLQLDPEHCP